jgi:hypothetical protein
MYFSKFPTGNYDMKGDGNQKLVTDLMKRVKVRSKIINEASLYDGVAELWFETEADFTKAYQTELGKAVAADSLAHVGRRDRLFVEENVLFDSV